MDMEGGAAQGDLADVVARASAMATALPSLHRHHQLPTPSPPSFATTAAMASSHIVMNPYGEEEEDSRRHAAMFDAVDPYRLSSSVRGGYGMMPPQQMAAQISQSQHACMFTEEGEDAMRSSQPAMSASAAAAHQMMKRLLRDESWLSSYLGLKNDVKKVVCIPAPPAASSSRPGGGEVIPSDLWAWRKYGQKPIKGSPYPRGYYRCSSSKGCMARKQVERSRSDPNMLVITYTAEHNHPWPMQRNVLAGYSRPHTHVPTNCKKKNYCRADPTNSMSPSSSKHDVEYQHSSTTDYMIMESNAGAYRACTMGALSSEGCCVVTPMPPSCNIGIQPADEVFAQLEELESSNSAVNANVYSKGVAYEWNMP